MPAIAWVIDAEPTRARRNCAHGYRRTIKRKSTDAAIDAAVAAARRALAEAQAAGEQTQDRFYVFGPYGFRTNIC